MSGVSDTVKLRHQSYSSTGVQGDVRMCLVLRSGAGTGATWENQHRDVTARSLKEVFQGKNGTQCQLLGNGQAKKMSGFCYVSAGPW